MDQLERDLEAMKAAQEERDAISCRSRILHFGDETIHGVRHTKEHFDQILRDITSYERYCDDHPHFENNTTVLTSQRIKDIYEDCLAKADFPVKRGAGRMKMLIIAAAAMAGGPCWGLRLCWAATRLAGGTKSGRTSGHQAAKRKWGTMDKVLILEAVVLVLYTAADLVVFWHTGNEPDTLTACVFGVCGFEKRGHGVD